MSDKLRGLLTNTTTYRIKYFIDNAIDKSFIKEFRYKNSLSQRVLAEILGVSIKAVEKWEQSKTNPMNNSTRRLIYILDKNPSLIKEIYSEELLSAKTKESFKKLELENKELLKQMDEYLSNVTYIKTATESYLLNWYKERTLLTNHIMPDEFKSLLLEKINNYTIISSSASKESKQAKLENPQINSADYSRFMKGDQSWEQSHLMIS